jgi:hypothetical protein
MVGLHNHFVDLGFIGFMGYMEGLFLESSLFKISALSAIKPGGLWGPGVYYCTFPQTLKKSFCCIIILSSIILWEILHVYF